MLRTAENTICFKLFLYKTTCPVALQAQSITSRNLPESPTTATHGLWSYLSGKVFSQRFFSRYKLPCYMEKCKRYESNIPQQAYKACPITAWVLLQNESERIRTFNILPPARSLSNTRFPCARLPFRHTLLNGISAVSNIFFVLCFALGSFLSHSSDYRVLPTLAPFPFYCPQWLGFCSCNATYTL